MIEEAEMVQEITSIEEAINDTNEASNEAIAEYLAERIKFDMSRDILVKPLAPVMIKREFSVPVVKDEVKEGDAIINEYDEVAKEIREVESTFAKGIILKIPAKGGDDYKIGDTVVYNKRFAIEFDLLKNSMLVKPYDIVAVEN